MAQLHTLRKLHLLVALSIGIAVEARAQDQSERSSLLGTHAGEPREFSDLKMTMLWCPPGTFKMGSPVSDREAFDNERPQVDVTLSRGFWLGQTEVTQGQWEELMGTTPWTGREFVKEGLNYPAVYVSHGLSTEFCRKLTASEREAGRLPDDWVYTLPTEAQWEYACRAGTSTNYSFGDNARQLGDYAWYKSNTLSGANGHAHPVGNKLANPWGFHDMHGNVLEWCLDGYNPRLPGGRDPFKDTYGFTVTRGGSWRSAAWSARSAFRHWNDRSAQTGSLGLRLALSP